MDDYYSLLGVDAEASVDDIRGAYRIRKESLDTGSEAGRNDAVKLNKAWNVLSDPYQRGRYDEQRTLAADQGELGVDDDGAATPVSNGRSSREAKPKGLLGQAKSSRQERAASTRAQRIERMKTPTISPPPGTHFPSTKQRIIAMVIDLLVLIVLVSGSQIAAQAVAKAEKPGIVKQINAYNDKIDAENKSKSAADKAVSADKKANNTAQAAIDQKTSDNLKNQITADGKSRDDLSSKLNPYFLGAIVIAFFLGFLYLAIPTAITGRTLGKRFQHLKTLREDGSPLGLRGAVDALRADRARDVHALSLVATDRRGDRVVRRHAVDA